MKHIKCFANARVTSTTNATIVSPCIYNTYRPAANAKPNIVKTA